MILRLAPGSADVSWDKVYRLVSEAFAAADVQLGEAEARAWGGDFTMPRSHVAADEGDLISLRYDLGALVSARQRLLAPGRLSVARAKKLNVSNPDRGRAIELAAAGMPVLRSESFVGNGHAAPRPTLKPTYLRVHAAVDRILYESYVKTGLALLLTKELVSQYLPEVHLSLAGWTPKYGKACGRPLTDMTFGVVGNTENSVLNTQRAKELSDEKWGVIHHPTIEMYILMILAMQQLPEHVGGRDLELWKTDVAAAFLKLFFAAQDVCLVAVELVGGLIMLFLAGVFGWSGTPAAFAVITRALLFEFRLQLSGRVDMYVDDAYGVCAQADTSTNLQRVENIVCSLLGPGSLERAKTGRGRSLDVLGYKVDLDTQCLSIARKNWLRALYGFFLLDETPGTVSVRTMERLASWASRYGLVCRNMRPWCKRLYAAYAGRNQNAVITLTEELWRICRLFQTLLVLSVLDEERYARPFSSFSLPLCPIKTVIEFDGSLNGGGGLIYAVANGVDEHLIGGFAIDLRPLGFGTDASFQNCAEFITAVVAIRTAHLCGCDVTSLLLRGDSVTALSWAEESHFSSVRVTQAATVYVFATTLYRVARIDTEHKPKVTNTRADDLSRGMLWCEAQEKYKELRGRPLLETDAEELILLCDPRIQCDNDDVFADTWGRIRRILAAE